jgi:very-short-patch-repair endonuclease
MGSFILDFYCSKLLLCIEIDGNSHDDRQAYDTQRDERLNDHGIEVIRFTNDSVLNQLANVYDVLQDIIKKREKTL